MFDALTGRPLNQKSPTCSSLAPSPTVAEGRVLLWNSGNTWEVSLLVHPKAGGLIDLPVTVSAGQATVQVPGLDWADIEWAAMVVGNPTPINPAISYSFSARAIAPILITHDPLWDRAEGPVAPVVRASFSPGTSSLDPSSPGLTYRVNGGSSMTVPMSATGTPQEYAATLPNPPAGTTIEYRIDARSIDGGHAGSPSVAGAYHAFEGVSVFEPFETVGGWTVGDAGDDAVTGVWERLTPRGTPAAPYLDTTPPPGSACFVTQNGSFGGLVGEADVDGGKTTLRSPVFHFYDRGPLVRCEARYRRWYSNEIGTRPDDAWRVDASVDGGATWVNVETVAIGQERWVPVTIDLLARFGAPHQAQFRFVAQDTGRSSLVEAAIDDFEILAVPQNPVSVPEVGSVMAWRLGPATPNPSRGAVRLRLALPAEAAVSATIRDLQGRAVKRLFASERRPAGWSWITWDGHDSSGAPAPAGIYWLDVRAGARELRRELVRLAAGLPAP